MLACKCELWNFVQHWKDKSFEFKKGLFDLWLCLFGQCHPMTFLQTSAHCGFSSPFELPVKKMICSVFLSLQSPLSPSHYTPKAWKLWNFTEPLQKISISKAIKRRWSCNAWASSTKLDQFSTPFSYQASCLEAFIDEWIQFYSFET